MNDEQDLDPARKHRLLRLARVSIRTALDGSRLHGHDDEPWLRDPGACFVTLQIDRDLRGCVGSLEARRALGDDVRSNAVSAAFEDPRFPPLSSREFDSLTIEVSLLSKLERVHVVSEADALAKIRPGKDGLVIRRGARRGTLLPQVWEDLPDPVEFLGHVKRKAGLPIALWDDQMELYRYTVSHFSEIDTELQATSSPTR